MTDELNFESLLLMEVPVTIADAKYVLREADENAAAAYSNASIAGAKMEDGRLIEMPKNLAGIQSLLVSRCLFPLTSEGIPQPQPIAQSVVRGWPARVVKPLFEKIKEISELNEDESLEDLLKQQAKLGERIVKMQEKAVKNEQGGMENGLD